MTNKILNVNAYWIDKNELIAIINLDDFEIFKKDFKKYYLWDNWGFSRQDWKFYKYEESLCCCEWITDSNYIGLKFKKVNVKDIHKKGYALEMKRFYFELHKFEN